MTKMKFLGAFLLVLAVLFAQVGGAAAAPQIQDGTTLISGTVTEIGQPQTDANGVTTVLVKVEKDGVVQTVRVSEEIAATLEVGKQADLTVAPGDVIPVEAEGDVHPIAGLIADFFEVSPSTVNDYHENGIGFGVIAQAFWMARDSKGNTNAELANAILEAKKSGNYDDVTKLLNLDSDSAPTNWGQLKKVLKDHQGSVGAVKSQQANDEDPSNIQNKDNKDKGNKNKGNDGTGKGNDGNNGKGKGNDGNNGKGKGNGKP